MEAGSTPSPLRPGMVVRERHCRLELAEPGVDPKRLATYLALVERPLSALLARDRLRRMGSGRFSYQSHPFRLLHFKLVPSLELRGVWQAGELQLTGDDCRIIGLGRWERSLDFGLSAWLRPTPDGLDGRACVSLVLPPALPAWSHSLAGTALEQVLDRIERRLGRGLRKDLLTWLLDPAVSG